ncbi:hypothetical protein K450DRAFT_271348 [Umbelopsis ramanniana AG]|uniref:Uncharacterized protein n=1 Tax=Umbelopsis ramanniana AG TaxID=1314678 RepID=A0AAD5E9V1_UMBRA|nr:uncharacterized protein K450DRAFT_271348 [Umbelopsis ramanniana AG]KAI8579996.1 hypothetical protein K450DRAFT_271348 [Umbelopsis ramanniana AG]
MFRLLQTITFAAILSIATADVFITTFTSTDCTTGALDFMIQSGSGVVQTQPFQSFRTRDITGNDIVTVCAQGFSCAQANLNAAPGLQGCVKAPSGSFDKLDDERGQ